MGTPNARSMKFDIEALSVHELDALIATAEKRRSSLSRRRPLALVRAELIAFAASSGYKIEELVDTGPAAPAPKRSSTRRKTGKVAVKYRDPENKRNTWSGRGSQPRWLREKVRRGLSTADFLVPGLAKPTANAKSIGQRSVFKQG